MRSTKLEALKNAAQKEEEKIPNTDKIVSNELKKTGPQFFEMKEA